MKRVSFEVAKYLKEVGYPQEFIGHGMVYNTHESLVEVYGMCASFVAAPTYLEVWLWLWREKKSAISLLCDEHELINSWYVSAKKLTGDIGSFTEQVFFNDPEEAIIAAIEYLVENGLIK